MIAKQWIYKASDGSDFTLVAKPTTRETISDHMGNPLSFKNVPAVKLTFTLGTCVVNSAMAKRYNYPMEDIVKMIESQPQFGKTFFLAQSPGELADPEVLKRVKEADKAARSAGPKVRHGARATGRG